MKSILNLSISTFAYLSAIINADNSDFVSNTTFPSYQSVSSISVDTSDNSVYLYGQFNTSSVYLLKLDSAGNQVWASTFGNQTFPGDITSPQPQIDQQTGDVYVAGWTRGSFDGQATGHTLVSRPTLRSTPVENQWNSVAWSPELRLFVAVALTGTGNRIMSSPDGTTWTIRTSPADNTWNSVTWSSDLRIFCAVSGGTTNAVMTSADGISWTLRSVPSGKPFII